MSTSFALWCHDPPLLCESFGASVKVSSHTSLSISFRIKDLHLGLGRSRKEKISIFLQSLLHTIIPVSYEGQGMGCRGEAAGT